MINYIILKRAFYKTLKIIKQLRFIVHKNWIMKLPMLSKKNNFAIYINRDILWFTEHFTSIFICFFILHVQTKFANLYSDIFTFYCFEIFVIIFKIYFEIEVLLFIIPALVIWTGSIHFINCSTFVKFNVVNEFFFVLLAGPSGTLTLS